MIASQRLMIATVSVFCALLVVPATGSAAPGDPGATPATGGDVAVAPMDTADPTGPTGSTDPTGSTGQTGPTGPTGAGGDDGGLVPTSPEAPGTAPAPEEPAAPGTETPGAPAPAPDPGDGDDTDSGDERDGSSGGAGRRDDGGSGTTQAGGGSAQRSAAAGGRDGAAGAAKRTRDALRDTGLNSVQDALVVTQFVERIPDWMRWLLAALAFFAALLLLLVMRERRHRHEAEQDAMVDALTGISNRKAFDRRLDLEWRRASRYGRELGLMIVDLDDFKLVNDNHGHSAGDRLLREIAGKLDDRMRDTDLVARIGGDEFAIICPETGLEDLSALSEELAERATDGLSNPVGVSIGVAGFRPDDQAAAAMLDRADASMYRVKRGELTSA